MMTFDSSIKSQAISLRKKGLSYSEISKTLSIPKSTLSYWLSSLPLSKIVTEKNRFHAKIIAARNITIFNKQRAVKYKEETEKILTKHALEIKKLSKNDLFYLGLGLFLGESGKKERWSVRFANSDPVIIKIIMRFFRETCKVDEEKVHLRVQIYQNIDNKKAISFWSQITNIPQNKFWKSQVSASSENKSKKSINRLPYGTLHVIILSTEQIRKIKGWMKGLALQFEI